MVQTGMFSLGRNSVSARLLWPSPKRVIMKDLMDHFMRSDLIQDASNQYALQKYPWDAPYMLLMLLIRSQICPSVPREILRWPESLLPCQYSSGVCFLKDSFVSS